MIEKFLETKNGKIYYWTWTPDVQTETPTVVFLHGLSSNHTTWDETLLFYKNEGFNIILVDLRGHGLSDKTRKRNLYRIPVMRNDVVNIVKSEKLSKVIIVGYSYGGYIGIDMSISNPEMVENLVLISANHTSQFIYHWFGFITYPLQFFTNLLGWLFVWQSRKKYPYFNPKTAVGYWKSTFSGLATMPISINLWMLSEVFGMDYRNEISRIKARTLIVRGAGDKYLVDAEVNDMHRKIINSEVVTIGEGHYIASHFQTDTAKAVINFLKS